MSPHRPHTKGYLVKHTERGKPVLIVGADDKANPADHYLGPRAEITWDDTWLHIVTDKYEGHVMLNIETLAPLRQALAQIARQIKPVAHR